VRRSVRTLTWALLLATAVACGAGCDAFAWILVQTVGPFVPEDESKAEYDLQNRSIVILVDAKDTALASEFPRIEVSLAEALAKVLAEKKACGPIVPPHSVETVRQAERSFPSWSIAQVGEYFNVDVVLHVELFEFRLKDDPSSNIYRGYTEAAIRLVSPDTGEQVWPVLAAARLVKAETIPDASPEAEDPVRQERILIEGFAEKIARHFYTYKLSELPLRPKVK